MRRETLQWTPWMWVLLAIGVLLFTLKIDSVAAFLNTLFGEGTDKVLVDAVMIALIVCSLISQTKPGRE